LLSKYSKNNRKLCANKIDIGDPIASLWNVYKILCYVENVTHLMQGYGYGVCTATAVSVLQFSVAHNTAISH
jgi:hypothetical protein